MKKRKAPALLRRMPWRLNLGQNSPFKPEHKAEYSSLAPLFDHLEAAVEPAFRALNEAALRHQLNYRRFKVALILGSGVIATLGAAQAAFPTKEGLGVAVAIVSVLTAGISRANAQLSPQTKYLLARAKAEELRSLYFHYLAQLEVADSADLERQVAGIRYVGGGSTQPGVGDG